MALKRKQKESKELFKGEPESVINDTEVQDGKGKKKQKPKKRVLIRLIAAVLTVAILVSAALIFLKSKPLADEKMPVIDEKYMTPKYLSDKTINILICGIDTDSEIEGDDTRTVSMTDVIMVVNLDRESGKVTVLQIPRDVYVGEIVPYGKINGLYQWGITDKKPEKGKKAIGIEPLIQVINEQFRLTIDNYALITMEGFRNAVDLIGGVEIILGEDEEPVDFEGHFVIKPGSNVLNGETAEVFVRYRNYEHADIDRLRMQERFMEALMRKLFSLSFSETITMTRKIRDYLVSDMDIQKMIALLKEVRQLEMEDVRVIRVPGEPVPNYGLYGVNVFSVHKKQLADLLNMYMRPHQEDVQEAELKAIEIQNTNDDFVDSGSVLGEQKPKKEDDG